MNNGITCNSQMIFAHLRRQLQSVPAYDGPGRSQRRGSGLLCRRSQISTLMGCVRDRDVFIGGTVTEALRVVHAGNPYRAPGEGALGPTSGTR